MNHRQKYVRLKNDLTDLSKNLVKFEDLNPEHCANSKFHLLYVILFQILNFSSNFKDIVGAGFEI